MLAEFLFGAFRTRILSALLLHPDTAWHVRALARHLNVLPASLNRELIKLAEAGILSKQQIGNQVHYHANSTSPVFSELASILRKTSGLADILAQALLPLFAEIQCALIFGSVARGEEQANSDVDVLVLGDAGFADVIELLHPVQAIIGREINPVVYRTADFVSKLQSNNTWAREIVNKPKIFINGNADDFAKLTGHTESD